MIPKAIVSAIFVAKADTMDGTDSSWGDKTERIEGPSFFAGNKLRWATSCTFVRARLHLGRQTYSRYVPNISRAAHHVFGIVKAKTLPLPTGS